MFRDFMIKLDQAKPEEGMEVIVRLENQHVVNAVYNNARFEGVRDDDIIMSWMPYNSKCNCVSNRWNDVDDFKCPTCGIEWNQQELMIDDPAPIS